MTGLPRESEGGRKGPESGASGEDLPDPELARRAAAIAADCALRAGIEEPRLVARAPACREWRPFLLRTVYAVDYDVFTPLGDLEIVLDSAGRAISLRDPRHAPDRAEVHRAESEALETVLAEWGLRRRDIGEEALERVRVGPGFGYRVSFVVRPRPGESGSPERVEALVNADTGAVIEWRRRPALERGGGGAP